MPAFSLAHTPHDGYPHASQHYATLPYPTNKNADCRGFGGVLEPHYIVGAEPLDQ